MNQSELWPLGYAAMRALQVHYGPAIDAAAESLGIPLGEWYGWLMAARIFEPEPVSAARLSIRSAYTALDRLEAHLATGARLGLLDSLGGGEYRLTDAGHAGVQRLIDTAYAAMAPLQPLPARELRRLAALLRRLVMASLAAPEPPGKFCLGTARHYDPGESAPVMVQIDQYLSDLNAYRDDAHLAAWQPLGVDGRAWEALALVWYGQASTPDKLAAKLARRGYGREGYLAALRELAGRGWVVAAGRSYRLTDQGRAVREEAEALTDRYFYTPWSCLSEAETTELADLLRRLREGLDSLRR